LVSLGKGPPGGNDDVKNRPGEQSSGSRCPVLCL